VNSEKIREALLEILKEKSVRWGTFTLTSGKTSDFYVDCRQTALHSRGGSLIGMLMYDKIRQFQKKNGIDIKGVAGLTLGADPIVSATSVMSNYFDDEVHGLIVRKEPKGHGTGNYIEGRENVPKGSMIAVVDDVATTGGSLLKTIERVEADGYIVSIVIVVVDRDEGAKEVLAARGYSLEAIFKRKDFE
jgi:orotate phosphoribosyltransferase